MSRFVKYRSDQFHTIIYKQTKPEDILTNLFGEKYLDYRKKWDQSEKYASVQDFPLHLSFELFYGCNLRCAICTYSIPLNQRNYKVEPKKRITFEKYCEIVDAGVKHGLYAVQLNGYNEPLLERNIAKYVRYARKAGVIDTFIITNATLLTPKISKELIEAELTQIKFSIDSIHKDTYEKLRIGASFEETMNKINTFLQIKKSMAKALPITRVSFVKTKENMQEVDEFITYWADRVDYVTIQGMANPFWGHEKFEKIERSSRVEKVLPKKCCMPYQRLVIQNNGEVLPCCASYGREIPVGNIYKNSIYEIWNSERMKKLRIKVAGPFDRLPLACKKCLESA